MKAINVAMALAYAFCAVILYFDLFVWRPL